MEKVEEVHWASEGPDKGKIKDLGKSEGGEFDERWGAESLKEEKEGIGKDEGGRWAMKQGGGLEEEWWVEGIE